MEEKKILQAGDLSRSDLPRLVGECVEKLRKDVNAGGLSNVEIEARLGHFNRITKGFVSGVSRRYFEEMKATLVKAYNSRAQSNRNCRYFDHEES